MELMKGVHVIETYATTTLLVDDRLVLIDTSADADGGKVLDYFAKIKMRPKDLSTIFITHTHPDHVGGLAAIKHGSPAKVASSRIEADFIARRRVYDGPPGVQRHPDRRRGECEDRRTGETRVTNTSDVNRRQSRAEVYQGARFICASSPRKSRRLPPVVGPIERPRPAVCRHRGGPRDGRRVRGRSRRAGPH